MKKQIELSEKTIKELQKNADAEGRSLKNFIERILIIYCAKNNTYLKSKDKIYGTL